MRPDLPSLVLVQQSYLILDALSILKLLQIFRTLSNFGNIIRSLIDLVSFLRLNPLKVCSSSWSSFNRSSVVPQSGFDRSLLSMAQRVWLAPSCSHCSVRTLVLPYFIPKTRSPRVLLALLGPFRPTSGDAPLSDLSRSILSVGLLRPDLRLHALSHVRLL